MGLARALVRMCRKVSAGMQALSELGSVENRARQDASIAAVVGSLLKLSTLMNDDNRCGGGRRGAGVLLGGSLVVGVGFPVPVELEVAAAAIAAVGLGRSVSVPISSRSALGRGGKLSLLLTWSISARYFCRRSRYVSTPSLGRKPFTKAASFRRTSNFSFRHLPLLS